MKLEVLKKLLIVEIIFLIIFTICAVCVTEVDFVTVLCAWIALMGVTTGVYAWKAKSENRIKIPIKVLESLPEEMLDRVELTTIITAIIQSE